MNGEARMRGGALCAARRRGIEDVKGPIAYNWEQPKRLSVPVCSMAVPASMASVGAQLVASSSPHSAIMPTLTHLALTAVAIASGACLSEQLWPHHAHKPPEQVNVEGVDVTGYPIFQEPEIQKAIDYAKMAHFGQMRKSGEPYITHCIHTAKILAALVPDQGKRALDTVIAGLLHDVIDDTNHNLKDVKDHFGDDVAKLVSGVSKLSCINQLLRRHQRTSNEQGTFNSIGPSPAKVDSLRLMLLGMINDPRVVLVKLADRLHNMRTIYALPPSKARAVAQETLAIWCSLASRLGVWAVKSELEDLCFAVLQPDDFIKLRAELAAMWSPSKDWRYLRRMTKRAKRRALLHGDDWGVTSEKNKFENGEEFTMQELLEAVVPFDLLLDRDKRSHRIWNHATLPTSSQKKTKVMQDAEVALAALTSCEEALERELLISTSYVPGMEVTLSGRLKSLYSTFCKMKRKGVDFNQIYDARALRVIVGDGGGKLHVHAVEGCYNLLSIVHSLWTPIDGEFDDYIVNPKPSGYQSLHTAVKGPDGAPLEVQIRTQGMHGYAECGHAAHWLYKESDNTVDSSTTLSKYFKFESDDHKAGSTEKRVAVSDIKDSRISGKARIPVVRTTGVGHPALRVEDGRLLAAVVVRVENDGRDLLVAVSLSLLAREAVAAGRLGNQRSYWEAYARLYKKVFNQWWFAPGHGDWSTFLERYTLCRDGIYHKQDQFDRLLPTFIQLLDLSSQENAEYWKVMHAVVEGKEMPSLDLPPDEGRPANNKYMQVGISTGTRLNNKVRFLRSMLQWEQELQHKAAISNNRMIKLDHDHPDSIVLTEVLVIRWPDGEIMRMPSDSTAGDVACRMGMDGNFIYVNGHLSLPDMRLKNGDIVEVRM